jgi:hypothetical protein
MNLRRENIKAQKINGDKSNRKMDRPLAIVIFFTPLYYFPVASPRIVAFFAYVITHVQKGLRV